MRNEVRPSGVEIVTVCLETLGPDEGRPFVDAAGAAGAGGPALLDRTHQLDAAFGVVNIPNAVWIDEDFRIVRPVEPAWPGPRDTTARSALAGQNDARLADMGAAASQIVAWTEDRYADAVRDWAAHGSGSRFVLSAAEVLNRSAARTLDTSAAAAHFELAADLERNDRHRDAVEHFRAAHRLAPDNWTYKRQAWSLQGPEGPYRRFWQGPQEGQDWEYESDWLADITAGGAADYYVRTELDPR